jgi:hypothetical protein
MTQHIAFPEPTVPRETPLGSAEPVVNWYLESTRREAAAGRAQINQLYASFPDPSGLFLARLRSANNADHLGALDELFVYERMAQRHRVAYEEGGEGPDFRAYTGDENVAGVEVLSIFMRQDWSSEEQRHGRLRDELNSRVALSSHIISFEIKRWDREPRMRDIADWVRRIIDELAPPDSGNVELARHTFRSKAVELDFTFFPRQSDSPPKPTARIVALGPSLGGWVNSDLRLRDALDAKAGNRYDLRSRPFAILIGVHDVFCSLDQIMDALLGGEQVAVATGNVSRRGDGFYGSSQRYPNGKNRRVSCVFALHDWMPGVSEPRLLRFDNPFCEMEFPVDVLPADFRLGVAERSQQGIRFGWYPTAP